MRATGKEGRKERKKRRGMNKNTRASWTYAYTHIAQNVAWLYKLLSSNTVTNRPRPKEKWKREKWQNPDQARSET
jgi:hypothetical protein